jgi:hypothetical protein
MTFTCTPVLLGQELAVYALWASDQQLKPVLACLVLQTHGVLLDDADALLPWYAHEQHKQAACLRSKPWAVLGKL